MAPMRAETEPRARGSYLLVALKWLVVLLAWAAVVLGMIFTIPTLLGKTPHRVYSALQLVRPWLGLFSGLCLLVAVVYRRPFLAVASGFCVLANVLPVWGAVDHVHVAPMSDAAISIYVSNMRLENQTPEAQIREALSSGADVLVLVEFGQGYKNQFEAAGVDAAYPYHSLLPGGAEGIGIYSRRPLLQTDTVDVGDLRLPVAEMAFGDGTLRILGVHTNSPKFGGAIDPWLSQLDALDKFTQTPGLGPTVLAGDYNATRWHPAMRQIMDGPFVDAHEEVGKGLTSSWPANYIPRSIRFLQPFAPFARLDHALVHDVGVVSVTDGYAAGSDHVPFEVTIVPQ
jgi:endonuclease/exonuclease/phosphatase (EEP) superfamily protein YafD